MLKDTFDKLNKLNYGYEYWYELSSGTTPKEFNDWVTKHSNQIKKVLSEFGITKFDKVSKNHFSYTMFAYSEATGWIYISIGDVRSPLEKILIRTAENNKDYSGGSNNYISLRNVEVFEGSLNTIITSFKKAHKKGVA